MATNNLRYSSPMGIRLVSSPTDGTFSGERLSGRIAPGLASEWQLESLGTPGLAFVDGLITLLPDEGEAILMKYAGRRSPRYGATGWRIGIAFEAPAAGPHDWLNDVVGIAHVEQDGDDLRFTVLELLGRKAGADAQPLSVEPLYQMRAAGSIGERHLVKSRVAMRYLTIAEEGVELHGRLNGRWPVGFAWGPHRCDATEQLTALKHIEMRAGIVADNGEPLVQSYIGTVPRSVADRSPGADISWITVATFEAPAEGPLAYLNEILAIGIGWAENNEAYYDYRIWL